MTMNPLKSSVILDVLDALFALTLVAPAVVGYWRGTWNLMGHYVYTDNEIYSSFVSLAIGFIGMFIFCLAQGPIKRYLEGKSNTCFALSSWVYTAVYGFICVNSWRGAWLVGNLYQDRSLQLIIAVTLSAVLLLGLLKTLRNISAPPCVVTVDDAEDYFDSHQKKWLYVIDCLFSVFIVGSLVVVVWRGAWVILDNIIFPDDPSLSALASLALGYGIVILTFSLQPIMRWTCARLEGFWRVLVADLFLFFSFIGTVNVWRSIWQLLDLYFLPEHRIASDWITHAGCLFVLMVLNCGNSVLVRGVYVDAEENAGDCVMLPVQYLTLYFKREKDKRSRHKSTSEALFTKPQHIKFMEQGQECENLSENEQGTTVEDSLLYKHSGPVVVIVTNNTDASDKGSQNNCK
ncbi:uncharacterized protein LOC113365685 isoform X2 [Ctenocephalides felis]|uniref:uncharacterized protein LOC113365685 isoform X2 n=1 Tax=Ctenocephalides felis TaxID=7515 RepID=UPI000E6E2DBE|nr:uncharacterized protein LOC113365685 isoform X2 [Ctenocephalides felis]